MKKSIRDAVTSIELKYKVKISYEFIYTPNLTNLNRYGLNPTQIPAVLVNGRPEFGGAMEPRLVAKKLDLLHKTVV